MSNNIVNVYKEPYIPDRNMTKTVLVVDDDEDWQKIFQSHIAHIGHLSIAYTDSDAAIEAIKDYLRYDLALVDIELPGRDSGLEVIAESKKYNPEVPVLIVSGWPREKRVVEGHLEFFDIGKADGYIYKKDYDRNYLFRLLNE